MCRWICLIVLGVAASTVSADEKPKPNTLTQKEIEEGWILLFDGETTFGWKIDGDVKVVEGRLVVDGTKTSSITTTGVFRAMELRFECQQPGNMTLSTIGGDVAPFVATR